MLRWAVHLEGGPRRVNHAAVAVGHKVYSFGGYCSGEDYETLQPGPMDGWAPKHGRQDPWIRAY
ncbi:kelch domain-containing protein 3 [Taeniopygia guttata]|uniref:Putative kelch domain containing 3 n=1 Tax=Taeniopygia guttata TaxID=59729 RepID=B5FZ52_TAEGU|nr:kelch domain-containing protein 3 [Taeniopygia guttata]ACH44313.1 putative kelch domain containing 3 [Taeniopygia guttata]